MPTTARHRDIHQVSIDGVDVDAVIHFGGGVIADADAVAIELLDLAALAPA